MIVGEVVRAIVVQLERVERKIYVSDLMHDLTAGVPKGCRLSRVVVCMPRVRSVAVEVFGVAVNLGTELHALGVCVDADQFDLHHQPVDPVANLRWQA